MTKDTGNENDNVFAIPVNYRNSGRVLAGMFDLRNVAEALLLVIPVGFAEAYCLALPPTVKIVIMTVTLMPLGVLACAGIDGDSLFERLVRIVRFLFRRKKLHLRRVGWTYDKRQDKGRGKKNAAAQAEVHSGRASG